MICISKRGGDALHKIIKAVMKYLSEQSCKKTQLIYKSDPTYDRVLQEEVKMGAYKFFGPCYSQQIEKEDCDSSSHEEEAPTDTKLENKTTAIHYISSPINVVTLSVAISLFSCPKPTQQLEFFSETVKIIDGGLGSPQENKQEPVDEALLEIGSDSEVINEQEVSELIL
jgi:hypothetical protein